MSDRVYTYHEDLAVGTSVIEDEEFYPQFDVVTIEIDPESEYGTENTLTLSVDDAQDLIEALQVAIAEIGHRDS